MSRSRTILATSTVRGVTVLGWHGALYHTTLSERADMTTAAIQLPRTTVVHLSRYLWHGIVPPGGVLGAVLAGDYVLAQQRATADQWADLRDVVALLGEYAPAGAWGDESRFAAWCHKTDAERAKVMDAMASHHGVDFAFDKPAMGM